MEHLCPFSNTHPSIFPNKTFHFQPGKWIRSGFSFLLLLFSLSSAFSQTLIQGVEEQDYNALVDFYQSTNGSSWTNRTGWLDSNVPVSNWYGVTVTNNRVTTLRLEGNNLTGSLPKSIGNLIALDYLSIQRNRSLKGPLPDVFHNLSNLRRLYLNNNGFTGNLPPSLGSCTNLEYMHLHSNNFSGSIPESYGNLKKVYQLYMSYNSLTGSIPESLMTLDKVMYFYLNNNSLSGSIPANIDGLSNARTILLYRNQISGGIPASIGNMATLQYLNLEDNQLSGRIPESLGGLKNVSNILLGNNQLSGEVPSTLGFLPNIQRLHLFSNQLTGPIPEKLGNLSTLKSFAVSGNQLSGTVPENMASLPALEVFDVSNNKISGLPSKAFSSPSLVELDVSNNHLTFEDLTPHKDNATINYTSTQPITEDQEISLSGGTFTIEGIDRSPDTYYKWYKNDTLKAEGNTPTFTITNFGIEDRGDYSYTIKNPIFADVEFFSGRFRPTLMFIDDKDEHAALVALYKSTGGDAWTNKTNWLQGSSSADFGKWHGITVENGNVTRIDLPKNNLKGPLPEELGNLKALRYLSLYSNQISSLPESLGKLVSLDTLYIFFNQLTSVPDGIGKLYYLKVLRLHGNQIQSLPEGVGNLERIEALSVHENQLTSLPESIVNLKRLKILYAYGNNLTSLPANIGSLKSLEWMYLKENNLSSLPASLQDLPNLYHLDVSKNYLPFEAIEQFFSGKNTETLSGRFYYFPQDTKMPIEIATLAGHSELLDARDNAPHNAYQWQKVENSAWTNIAEATSSAYETSLTEEEEAAFYRCLITNSWVTPDTLYSPVYQLKVSMVAESLAENLPDDASKVPPATGTINKPAESSSTYTPNHVRTFTSRQPTKDHGSLSMAAPVENVSVVTEYIDGLGRPLQIVEKKASRSGRDIILPIEYDQIGRQAKEYLAYAYKSNFAGAFQANALSQQYSFYHQSSDHIADTDYPFAENVFEPSPLNRVEAKAAPGESWRKDSGNEVKFSWRPNTTSLDGKIRIWKVNEEGQIPFTQNEYMDGRLWVTETTDEDRKKVWEYKDKLGQVVLKKVQLAAAPVPSRIEDYVYTYYVYDGFQNLRFVIQPQGVKEISANGWTVSSELKKQFCFSYRYDGRRRMIEKQVPGADPVYMVYNQRDLLVLSQDGKQRIGDVWSFTKYDALNRPIATGLLKNRSSSSHEKYLEDARADNVMVEKVSSSETGYTNRAFPMVVSTAEDEYLSLSYYDDYQFDEKGPEDAVYVSSGLSPEPVQGSSNKGRLVGSRTKILGTDKWLWTKIFYDNRGRVIQEQKDHHLDGKDVLTILYRNVVHNRVEAIRLVHTASGQPTTTIDRTFTYDHADRLLTASHRINDGDSVVLLSNEYNELGELVEKQLHKGAGDAAFHQAVSYRYNIRGWLEAINDAEAPFDPKRLFSMNLYYNYGFEQLNHNGNISGVKWKNPLSQETKAYGYLYDQLNRIKGAGYVAGSTGNWRKEVNTFDIGVIKYDYNGNIINLSRNGLVKEDLAGLSRHYGALDVLSYEYEGNRLRSVTEKGGAKDKGFKDGDVLGDAYFYDENGNLTEDKNKKITSIAYNHMNLPEKVVFTSGDYLEYSYDATGRKLSQKVYKAGEPVKHQDYIGELHYSDGVLTFINHEEGRVVLDEEGWEYQYHLKDHLGNSRLTFTSKSETDEVIATLETSREEKEWQEFLNFEEAVKVNAPLFDHSGEGTTFYSQRLSGSQREKIGLARSFAVLPGDVVSAAVYAKYVDPDRNKWQGNLSDLMAAIESNSGGIVLDGGGVSPESFPLAALLAKEERENIKGYLNIIIVDEQYNFLDGGYQGIGPEARETGSDIPHQPLQTQAFTITKPGYVYVYLSNEEDTPVDVFFDDLTVTHQKGAVVQVDDYYPFGLTFNSYVSGDKNKYLYNGKELQDETGWYDYGARMYDATIGRFHTIDPMSDLMADFTPYHYVYNNPLVFTDPTGMLPKYNWDTGKYENDDGKEVSFNDALAAHGENNNGGGNRPDPVGIGRGSEFNARMNGRDPYQDDECCAIQGKTLSYESPRSKGGDNSDAAFVNEVSMGLTPVGVGLDFYTLFTGREFFTGESVSGVWRYAGIIPFVSETRKGSKVAKAVTRYWPENGGALGKWETQYLMPGTEIDRFGSGFGRYFSPRGTPMNMRALPGGNSGAYNAFRVVKPFPVRSSTIAPAFNQFGGGIQYLSPVNMNTLLKRGIIVPIKN